MEINNDPRILHNKIENISNNISNKGNQDDEALKEVCKEFEAIFLQMTFKEMEKTVPEGGLIEKGMGTKIFEDMYIEEISKEMSKKDEGLGIGKMIYEQFKNGYVSL